MKCRMRSSEKPRKKGKVNGLGREMETGAKHASLCFWAPLRANIKVAFNIGSSQSAGEKGSLLEISLAQLTCPGRNSCGK